MQARLRAAEGAIGAAFDALAPDQRLDPLSGAGNASFSQWSAIAGPHECWRPNAGHHSAGAAIDINVADTPYIVTRNGLVAGGRTCDADRVATRERALAVDDRAMQFMTPPAAAADLSGRQPNESTQSVWTRFKAVSNALGSYLSFAVDSEPAEIARVAIENLDEISDDELLAIIPEGERLNIDRALARLERSLSSQEFQASHPGWPNSSRMQYLRILRDYEQARSPMLIGNTSPTPARTHNPARGFLNLRMEIVTALCDEGLRWGACDFGVSADGSSQNGAMMHFDLADDGGYAEINSLLRFG